MVFGLQLSFARVGSTVNFLVMEPLYTYVQNFYQGYRCTGVVLLIASLTCIMSMICGLILGKEKSFLNYFINKISFQLKVGWINEHKEL